MNRRRMITYREIDPQTLKHISRFLEGKDVWNEWAEDMLAKREVSETEKPWQLKIDSDEQFRYKPISLDTTRPEIQAWVDEAYVDFSNLSFQSIPIVENLKDINKEKSNFTIGKSEGKTSIIIPEKICNFSEFIFPYYVSFYQAHFKKPVEFNNAKFQEIVYFNKSKFNGFVEFNKSLFKRLADFNEVEFVSSSSFAKARFNKQASFIKANFNGPTIFSQANIKKIAIFKGAIFQNQSIFQNVNFEGKTNFTKTKFKGFTDFKKSSFKKRAIYIDTQFYGLANFSEVIFKGFACFHNSQFKNKAHFNLTKFIGPADFRVATFKNEATFIKVRFRKPADFKEVKFNKQAIFKETFFNSHTYFIRVNFEETADFSEAKFNSMVFFTRSNFKEKVFFSQTDFLGRAIFLNVTFSHKASFYAIKTERALSLEGAIFKYHVPNFIQSTFSEAPRLDDIEVVPFQPLQLPGPRTRAIAHLMHKAKASAKRRRTLIRDHFRIEIVLHHLLTINNRFFNDRNDKEEEAKFRALKRLAIQAHDHENEINFFSGEIRARRYIKDFPNPFQNSFFSSSRYWTGVLYELTSDFGRSFLRPISWWVIFFLVFTNVYFLCANPTALQFCRANNQIAASLVTPSLTFPWSAAATITAKNSLLFISTDRTEKLKRAYACLYGASPLYDKSNHDQNLKLKLAEQPPKYKKEETMRLAPNVPGWVSFLGVINSIISLALTFLFLLAIRNQFKIK